MAKRKILISTAALKWADDLVKKLQMMYRDDLIIINGPTNLIINYPKSWKQAIIDYQSYTHIIIIPYTLMPTNDQEMEEAIPIMLEEGRMIRAFEFLMANTEKQPKIVQLTNASKQDNWRLIVNFLSGIIIPK